MSEDKNVNISVVPKFADKALENMLDKPSKSIGDTFSDIWYLVLGGAMSQAAEKRKMKYAVDLEVYKKKIGEEIEKIPVEKRCEPDIQVIGSVLEASKYCAEKEELRNMFAKLIAASMETERKKYVRPLYVDIISKMTENDAKLFAAIVSGLEISKLEISDGEMRISLESLLNFGVIRDMENPSIFYSTLWGSQAIDEVICDGVTIKAGEEVQGITCTDAHGIKVSFFPTSLGMDLKKVCL